MELKHEIEKSGHLFPYFDYAHGYGIPQASHFILKKTENIDTIKPPFTYEIKKDTLYIIVKQNFIEEKNLTINNYLYYHIEDKAGIIEKYWLIEVYKPNAAKIPVNDFPTRSKLMVHYRGVTESIKLD
jgi:serine protease AprX